MCRRSFQRASSLASWSYAMAHGAQYVIFMIVVAGRCRHGLVGLAALVLVFAAMYVGFGHLNGSTSGSAFYTGLVMSHFLIDAKKSGGYGSHFSATLCASASPLFSDDRDGTLAPSRYPLRCDHAMIF